MNPLAAAAPPSTDAGRRPADAGTPDRVRALYAFTPATLVGNLIGAVVLVLLFRSTTPPAVMGGWCFAFAVLWLFRAWTAVRFSKVQLDPSTDFSRWQLRWLIGVQGSAVLWGLAVWLFYNSGDAVQQIGLIVTIYSYCVAAVPVLAEQPRQLYTFLGLCFVPMVLRILSEGTAPGYQVAGVLFLAMGMTALLGRNYREAMDRIIELKVETERLLGQLRTEKAVAEDARQAAEVANRAKTQFFAAASHDLRQPLHALGLFAEALRQKSRDEEVIQLVNSINSSVDALEGLFSELLDITKIDTGAVEPKPQHFSLRELFTRLRLHFEPVAFEKGLQLKFRGEQHFAYADPVLVDRILRNLVSNAIRYTEDGGVLVTCRPRRGEKLLVQVWDSGIGIREGEQARVFEEFYQVHADQRPAPHQRKGLGLGLSIALRLARLMETPLTLRSQYGRGTVFSLLLPLGRAQRAPEAPASRSALGLTLDRRLIVVVEDDAAVRDGLEVLLKGWGATVAAFDTVQACATWAQRSAAEGLRPDLAIVDYRIDHETTGIEALLALRTHFGPDLPAIVVTGSTTAMLDQEAARHGFHLLIKPVVPNKLRAMIAFKLGVRAR
ncbi:MAG TPA: hybrid sensor histidine kinase/response regulator [Burkholderiaceae bacterium]|nr:hybrid sensor histidine kinase/response regulator [Burkholderiaceae bacterium]